MTSAVIYTRVSLDRNKQARSVGEQEQECRAVCAREGWDVVEVVVDNDISASRYARKARENYPRLLELVASGTVDVLVTWENSRTSRDLGTATALRDLCRDHGVKLSYSGRILDVTTTGDAFAYGLDALMSERASSETRDRVLRASRSQAAAGLPHGKLLYGYRREYDGAGRFVAQVEDAEQAAVIREVARRVLAGDPLTSIARHLTDRGVPVPRQPEDGPALRWYATTVRRLLTNPGVNGKRVHRGEVVGDAVWPAIIGDADHARLVALLTAPERRTQRDSRVKHLLSGIARCGVCGGVLRMLPNRGTPSYSCMTRGCMKVSRAVAKVDAVVVEAVQAWADSFDALALEGEDDAAELQAARDEATQLAARLDGFVESALAGELSPKLLARAEADLLPRIAAAQARAVPRSTRAEALAVVHELARVWDRCTVAQRRAVVRAVMTVTVHPVGKASRTFDASKVEVDFLGA